MNTVGPANNFAETYKYWKLPFCPPVKERDSQRLGEVLAGEEKGHANYDIRFKVGTEWQAVCSKSLTADEVNQFIEAIKQDYWFEMFIDDLSIKGPVGAKFTTQSGRNSYYLVTHLHFDIAYNEDKVIAVNMTTDPSEVAELKPNEAALVEFSFSTKFAPTDVKYEDRHELHLQYELDDVHEIHWLSILNTLVMVILLVGFLAINLVRILKRDIAQYLDFEEGEEEEEDSGWKLLHADVFKPPAIPMLLSSAIGAGTQIFVVCTCVLILALFDAFDPGHRNRGALYAAFIFVYAFTAGFAGYVGTTYYIRWEGEQWVLNCLLSASMFAGPAWFVFAVCNTTAIVYGSSVALPFGTILLMLLLLVLVAVPLTVFGSWKALTYAKQNPYKPPCKTRRAPREIPPGSWMTSTPILMLISGILPFSAIYIEVHYIFNSIWGPRVYTLFGVLGITFFMLIIVVGASVIAVVYFKLSELDHLWQWRAFYTSSSVGLMLMLYSISYFHTHSEMGGVLQTVFYFSYTTLIAYGMCLMTGAVGFFFADAFVTRIYSIIKND